MKKKVMFFAIAFSASLNAQSISDVKEAVSFIYVEDSIGTLVPNGTCFFLGMVSSKDKSRMHQYLVTAKHVLKKKDGSFHEKIQVRMNTKDSSRFVLANLSYEGLKKNVFTHWDKAVDIAVIPFAPNVDDIVNKRLDTTFLYDRNTFYSLSISEGSEAFFTGLFVPFIGEKKIHPIVRTGHISLFSDEKIDWIAGKTEVFLVELSSFGGNSGSPVYFKADLPEGRKKLVLGGVLSGTYQDIAKIIMIQNGAKDTPIAVYNNGISVVVPVYFLYEILNSEELKKVRN